MGRTSASSKIAPGGSLGRYQSGPSSGSVDKVVPWKEMERRVAERLAAKAARRTSDIPPWKKNESGTASRSFDASPYDSGETDYDRAPDSGVRTSEPKMAVAPNGSGGRELTFTVYSVEELDARQRLSAPPPSVPPPPPSRWPEVRRSAVALVRTWWTGWYKTPKPRSRMMDVCSVPLATLKVDLLAALKQLPWRKIIIRSAIGVASLLALFLFVAAIAEVSDDVKPRPKTETAKVEAAPATPSAAPVAAVEAPAIELEDTPIAPAAPKKSTVIPAKKATATKKKPAGKKGADLFNP